MTDMMDRLLNLDLRAQLGPRIELETWERDSDCPALRLRRLGMRTYGEVLVELNARLDAVGYRPDEYGYTLWLRHEVVGIEDHILPPHRWIASYAVTGGSEGHYMHIDFLPGKAEPEEPYLRFPFAMAKTLREGVEGWRYACEIAAVAGYLLGA